MKYISTRNAEVFYSAPEAIVKGIADDGGLFVPSSFPTIDSKFIEEFEELSYPERVAKVLHLYMDEFSYDELCSYAEKAYSRFDGDPCPVVKIEDALFVMELWHGPTFAFKDMALTMLPHLMVASKKKLGIDEKTLVIVATSGDTGKAALEGFKNVDGTEVMVFFPRHGVSNMQFLQMATQEGQNLSVVGINGNFDDAQRAVKEMFVNEGLKANLKATGRAMSSANSINWGRLAPQIAYYVSSYADLVACGEIENGDKINFVVPTGNFGNILAGYYAYRMGLPVSKLIVASNANNVLTDFFNEGKYSINRSFYKTASPSMDILVSSNLERLLFELSGRDADLMKKIYADLKEKGEFTFDIDLLNGSIFEAGWADEAETKEAIYNYFDLDDVTFDPHTAVAGSVYNDYSIDTEDETPTIIVSTASPYKFPVDVLEALTGKREKDVFKAMLKLQNESGMDCPGELYYINEKKIIHKKVVKIEDAMQAVLDFALDTTRG